ncbi:MAG: pilus assembly protein PilM [Candidatus Falkowbacteria bacterium]
MHWSNIFIPTEAIAGVELSDTGLRFVLLKNNRQGKTNLATQAFEPISDTDLVGDQIINPENLKTSVANLAEKTKKFSRLIILSIPNDFVYQKQLVLPQIIDDTQLEESISLTANFHLPLPPQELYVSWQRYNLPTQTLAIIATAQRQKIDIIRNIFSQAGFHIVAIEYHGLSLARSIVLPSGSSWLGIFRGHNTTSLSLFKGAIPWLNHVVSKENNTDAHIGEDLGRLAKFAESENAPLHDYFCITEDNTQKTKQNFTTIKLLPIIEDQTKLTEKWAVAFGAAMRGISPRQQDNNISLTEISTQMAYAQKLASSLWTFYTRVSTLLAFLLVSVFALTWLFLSQLVEVQRLNSITSVKGGLEQLSPKDFNDNVSFFNQIMRSGTNFSLLIGDLQPLISKDIIINQGQSDKVNSVVTLIGTANTRSALNNLIAQINQSVEFTVQNQPLENLDKKTAIPFSLTIIIKNQQKYYGLK